MKKILTIILCTMFIGIAFSCDDSSDDSEGIAGTWVDGSQIMTLGKDGSYRYDGDLGQYRLGKYSYNADQKLMTVNVKAIEGMNGAYQQTYIVQTLTSTTLVLLYTDGDVEGYYTRQ